MNHNYKKDGLAIKIVIRNHIKYIDKYTNILINIQGKKICELNRRKMYIAFDKIY